MLKAYRYIETDHCKLHEFILAFFDRIELETGAFSMDFFEVEFQPIVNGHPTIVRQRCQDIFEIMRGWDQNVRTDFCQKLRDSNEIERICHREVIPLRNSDIPTSVRTLIEDLFKSLYKQVLDGDHFAARNQGREEHFKQFRHCNDEITICPFCGISELKMEQDDTRDQYDHYMALSIYPLSSVNFKNLVPICKECNGLDVKANKDILTETAGRIFYPYDDTHTGILIGFSITHDDVRIQNMEWEVLLTDLDGKVEEIESWKTVYSIESRYIGFIKGRIEKWHRHYWEYLHDGDLSGFTVEHINRFYFKFLEKDENNYLNFIRRPALDSYLSQSVLMRADLESQFYS